MSKRSFFVILGLAVVWIVLTENFTWESMAIGALVAMFCIFFSDMFLPSAKSEGESFKLRKLALYPFWLLGQVYKAAFMMVKFVITGAKIDFVPVKTSLKSEPLRILLADSMTFVPGSISVDIEDDTIMSLWIYDKKHDIKKLGKAKVTELAKGKLEKKLSKAEITATAKK